MTDPYTAADHDNYWERRRELAEGPEPEWPVCDQCGLELDEDIHGNPAGCPVCNKDEDEAQS